MFTESSIKNHLKPLAVTTNIAQAAHCHLDQVLLMFGLLVKRYTSLKSQEPDDVHVCCCARLGTAVSVTMF